MRKASVICLFFALLYAQHYSCTNQPTSVKYTYTALTQALKNKIVREHNAVRNGVQQANGLTSAEMPNMAWSDALEKKAKDRSQQAPLCYSKTCKGNTPMKDYGENPYVVNNPGNIASSVLTTLQYWYSFKGNAKYIYTPYTQMVWGTSTKIGCAYTDHGHQTTPKKVLQRVIICVYTAVGNNMVELPYRGFTFPATCTNSKHVRFSTKTIVDQALKNKIVKQHNDIRQGLGLSTTVMPNMAWDATMETAAKNLAKIDLVKQFVLSKTYGQNFDVLTRPGNIAASVTSSLTMWKGTKGSTTSKYTPYTQMVWSTSTKIACAYSDYGQSSKRSVIESRLFLCIYSAKGNKKNQLPYTGYTFPTSTSG